MNKNGSILEAVGVSKFYRDGNVHALVDASVAIQPGEFLAIMGPSGSGKSTLLCLLGALDEPDTGEIRFEGQRLRDLGSPDAFRFWKIGIVFQAFHLLPTLTAQENVEVRMLGALPPRARRAKARELLDSVGMGHRTTHLPTRLSVGERQRVAIARALANDPPIILADEPTGNLDSHNAEQILDLFCDLHRSRGKTLVIVTHSDEVAKRADRIIRLRDGCVSSPPSSPE